MKAKEQAGWSIDSSLGAHRGVGLWAAKAGRRSQGQLVLWFSVCAGHHGGGGDIRRG